MLGRHDITSSKQEVVHALGLALAYFMAAALAAAFMRFNGGLAMIWVATSLLTADLRHNSHLSWVLRCALCGIASVLATTFFGLGAVAAIPLAVINIGESLLSARLMRRYLPQASHLESLREVLVLMIIPVLLSPAVTGLLAAAVPHALLGAPYWSNWLGWTTGHSLGALTILPFIKLALGGDFRGWVRKAEAKDFQEAGLVLSALVVLTVLVFRQADLPLLFLPLLPTMIAVFRLGRLGAACSVGVLAILGIGFTLAGEGPFSRVVGGPGVQIQFLQLYLVTAMLMTLPAAAELRRRNKLLIRAEEAAALHRVIGDRTGDIILALEVDGSVRFASASIDRVLGIDRKQVLGRGWHEIALRTDIEIVIATQRFMELAPEETSAAEFRMIKADGSLGWFESHGRATIDADRRVSGFVIVLREVSERKSRELDLARAAETDPLTGVLNRRGFTEGFELVSTAGQNGPLSGCIAVFDLDHFKRVNDLYGHATGDKVIISFADLLMRQCRKGDLVGRLGGEEFAAYYPGVTIQEAADICESTRQMLEEAELAGASGLCPTVSVGLTVLDPAKTLKENLEIADRALYRAKAGGRNRLALAA
jgi:diguanylate cyclase (GGDEF)-like protein/PAS domain S-box-containing protein